MKKITAIAAAALVALTTALPIAAAPTPIEGVENCYYNYICNKSVNAVKADGVYNEDEWSDANELVINNDTLAEYGRWWSGGNPPSAKDLSATYKCKWDEKYFYLLEIRTDTHYVSSYDGNSYSALDPWNCDGTAFYFCDNALADASMRCDIKFYSYVDELKAPSVYVGHYNKQGEAFTGPSGEFDFEYGGSVNGDQIVFEMKMPWSFMDSMMVLDSEIKEGYTFRFNPIIISRDSIQEYNVWDDNSSFKQVDFHDCTLLGAPAGSEEDPNYWALLTLAGASEAEAPAADAEPEVVEPTVEEPEVAETAPEVVETPVETVETPVETAPQTFDMGIAAAIAAVVSLAGYAVSKKR